MSIPQELYIRFNQGGIEYDIQLTQNEKSDHVILLNGVNYSVKTQKGELEKVLDVLESIISDSAEKPIASLQDLQDRLSHVKDISSVQVTVQKADVVGQKTLQKGSPLSQAVAADLQKQMTPTIPRGAGASVLVSAKGEKPQHLGLGTTSVEGGHPIDENTAAVIGSGAKMFTGLLSKVLEDKGILSLQTKLSDVLEEDQFAIFEDPKAARDITLEMLLSHTSGLQFHAEVMKNEREGMSWDEILEGMCKEVASDPSKKLRLTGVPGDGVYAYSNQIALVGIFIEKAYNQAHKKAHPSSSEKFTYADIMRREIFEPLGMSRTSFVKPRENVMRAYRNDDSRPRSEDADIRDPAHQPVGGLWSTASDIGKLAQAFGKAFESEEGLKAADGQRVLLSPKALQDFLRPRGISGVTALGIDTVGPFFGKGGEISTYDFKFSFDRETGSYIVSLCNFKNSPEFGGEIEEGYRAGYINQVIPTLDQMHQRFTPPKSSVSVSSRQEVSPAVKGLPLHSCDSFYYGGMGIIGLNSKDPTWINWNGEILPLKKADKDKFVIVGENPHAGKMIKFGTGGKGNQYVFIEETPKTQKTINPIAFKAVEGSSDKSKVAEIEHLKRQKGFPLEEILGAQGTYDVSSLGAQGCPPISVRIDPEHGVIVRSQERLDASGHPMEVPMTISNSKRDPQGQLNEVWLVGSFMRVPLYQLKLVKDASQKWTLQVVDFASKDTVETLRKS